MKREHVVVLFTALFLAVCRAAPAQDSYRIIYDFSGQPDDGAAPYGSLIHYNGKFYGMTAGGGTGINSGTIFSIDADGRNYTVIHNFAGQPTDGEWPHGDLFEMNGKLYGMTFAGGCAGTDCPNLDGNGCGTIFGLNTDGYDFSILWSFACGGGDYGASMPSGNLISDGLKLYGTTQVGGQYFIYGGAIFSMNPDGTSFTILHSFSDTDGSSPSRTLALDGTTLYGMTAFGSAHNAGNIFSIQTSGTGFTILHEFSGNDGENALGGLTRYQNKLYGVTIAGGENNDGVAFSIDPDGSNYTVLHSFDEANGQHPFQGVTAHDGTLYGVTTQGGDNDAGVIFSLKTDGSDYTVLHRFDYEDGAWSDSQLLLHEGMLYGLSSHGGAFNNGVIYSYRLPHAPTPTPVPTIDLTVSSFYPWVGGPFSVGVVVQPTVSQAFDAWGVIVAQGGVVYSFDLSNPAALRKGMLPLATNVPGLAVSYTKTLFSTPAIPVVALGEYTVIVGLVPAGVPPSVQNAIPGYVDQESVRVR